MHRCSHLDWDARNWLSCVTIAYMVYFHGI